MKHTPTQIVERNEMRRWLAGRRAGEEREQQEARRHVMSTAQAVAASLSLFRLLVRMHGWPLPEDPVTRRENAQVQATWQRLREHYGNR